MISAILQYHGYFNNDSYKPALVFTVFRTSSYVLPSLFSPQEIVLTHRTTELVIPRKRWLLLDMDEALLKLDFKLEYKQLYGRLGSI